MLWLSSTQGRSAKCTSYIGLSTILNKHLLESFEGVCLPAVSASLYYTSSPVFPVVYAPDYAQFDLAPLLDQANAQSKVINARGDQF